MAQDDRNQVQAQPYRPQSALRLPYPSAGGLSKLLARSIPVEQAARILEDGIEADVIKIGGMTRPGGAAANQLSRRVRTRQELPGEAKRYNARKVTASVHCTPIL